MQFKAWKTWLIRLPWSIKWFVLLVLLRPFIDVFYFLKDISPLLSPLNLVGVLTPLLIVVSFISPALPRRESTPFDFFIVGWGVLLAINSLLIMTIEVSFVSAEIALKALMPVLLILYMRRLIRSKKDLDGLLTTFLYSAMFPMGMMLYEQFISPVGPTVQTRGHERFEGLFADVMSYGIYVIGALLIAGYFFFKEGGGESFNRRSLRLGIVGVLALMGLINMHHTASWMVAGMVIALLCFYSVKKGQLSTIGFVLVFAAIGYIGFGDAISERLGSALETDLAVLEGEKDIDRAFHGRVWRWKRLIGRWQDIPLLDKVVGLSVSSLRIEKAMLGSGIHNDYMRIVCVSGLIGFSLYMASFFWLGAASLRKPTDEQFLIQGCALMMLMYSMTTTPTMYMPMLNLVYAVFAYAALPVPVHRGAHRVRRPQKPPRTPYNHTTSWSVYA